MNEPIVIQKGQGSKDKPYHYRACGVDGIYLQDGYRKTPDEGYGEGTIIENADELHLIIGREIVTSRPHLTYKDVKFLREQMKKTQRQLANEIGVSDQMVARYEKPDQTDITGPADRLIRVLYVTHVFPDFQAEMMQIIINLFEEADQDTTQLVFSRAQKHWSSLGIDTPIVKLS